MMYSEYKLPNILWGCRRSVDLLTENPVIGNGEIMLALSDNGDVAGYKVGDGIRKWSQLPYLCTEDMSELEKYSIMKDLEEYEERKQKEIPQDSELILNGGSCKNV